MSEPVTRPNLLDQEAAEIFVRRLHGEWTAASQSELENRLSEDAAFAEAFSRAESSWDSLGQLGEAPEVMRGREEALAFARRASARRWLASGSRGRRPLLAAVLAGAAVVSATFWQLSPYGYRPGIYETGRGEQRTLDLEDHSRIALDAMTKVRVRFSKDVRVIELEHGQAQFNVAHDSARPFKVIAGHREIVAVGTVFTVEYADQEVRVAMLEGKVAVLDQSSHEPAESAGVPYARQRPIQLAAGEEMRVSAAGTATVTPGADLEAAVAWREGKIIFRAEPLSEAIRRVNRYSQVQIDLRDEALKDSKISGVFEAGDTQGFVDAIQHYLPVTADASATDRIQLRPR